jgi:hypothetical protein
MIAAKESRRLVLEGVVIVASILAAFALDTWWDSVKARSEEEQVLRSLDTEFRATRSDLLAQLDMHRRILGSVESVRASVVDGLRGGAPMVSVPDTALGWLYIPPTTQLVLGTLNGLVGSAGLGIVRDPELRSALAAWGNNLGELSEEEWSARELVLSDLDRVFRERMDVSPFRTIGLDVLAGTLTPEELGTRSTIPVDTELVGVVSTRFMIQAHLVDEFEPVLAEIERILDLIARSLEDRA